MVLLWRKSSLFYSYFVARNFTQHDWFTLMAISFTILHVLAFDIRSKSSDLSFRTAKSQCGITSFRPYTIWWHFRRIVLEFILELKRRGFSIYRASTICFCSHTIIFWCNQLELTGWYSCNVPLTEPLISLLHWSLTASTFLIKHESTAPVSLSSSLNSPAQTCIQNQLLNTFDRIHDSNQSCQTSQLSSTLYVKLVTNDRMSNLQQFHAVQFVN